MTHIIITAGGTAESIDGVRKITNTSTGRLGVQIYEALAELAGKCEAEQPEQGQTPLRFLVHYVVTEGAVRPEEKDGLPVRFYPVTDVRSAEKTLNKLMSDLTIGAVIHSMAVSDFTKGYLIEREQLVGELADALTAAADKAGRLEQKAVKAIVARVLEHPGRTMDLTKKVSSRSELMLSLVRTPKLISKIKQWDPNVFLVGFKLLRGASEEELIRAGTQLAEQNGCDLVLLNDQDGISETGHTGLLLRDGAVMGRYETKQEIADGIAACVVRDAAEKQTRVCMGGN